MKRRDFLTAASGVAGGAAAASSTAAGSTTGPGSTRGSSLEESSVFARRQEDEDGNSTDQDGGDGSEGELPGAGETEEVTVGPGGDLVFDPDQLAILPGTTVTFTWDSNNHNINVQSGPEDGWQGQTDLEDAGFTHEYTFEQEAEYEYICDPHVGSGMEATLIVTENPDSVGGGGGGGSEEFDPAHDLGVPLQKHFIGGATFAAIFVTFVFTFYVLKYGESSHSSSPNRK